MLLIVVNCYADDSSEGFFTEAHAHIRKMMKLLRTITTFCGGRSHSRQPSAGYGMRSSMKRETRFQTATEWVSFWPSGNDDDGDDDDHDEDDDDDDDGVDDGMVPVAGPSTQTGRKSIANWVKL